MNRTIVISHGSCDAEDLGRYRRRVVRGAENNDIHTVDNEVATLLGASTT